MAEALQLEHRKTLWTGYANALLGCWLMTGPFAFGYTDKLYFYNDLASGAGLLLVGIFSINYKQFWAPWAACFIGLWLLFSPLAFWAPDPSIYVNETLVGSLVFVFALLIPGIPGKIPDRGPSIPFGWSYNPSSWPQRMPIVFFGCIGWFISRYLAAYQLGYIYTIWDPFFGDGTIRVITSTVSKSFPVSDAGLGALAYTLEVLLAMKGDERRWRTMPWMVALFSILVVPLGIVTIILVILQPVIVGAWCSLCLFTAFCMMIMIAFAIDEVVAVMQLLKRKGMSVFFRGDRGEDATEDTRTPSMDASPWKILQASAWGITAPWNLALSALIGGWVSLSAKVEEGGELLANIDHIFGSCIFVIAVIAMAEVVRKIRYVNVMFGLCLIGAAVLFARPLVMETIVNHIAAGIFLILFSFRRGKIKEKF